MQAGANHARQEGVSLTVRVLCIEDCITMHFRLRELLGWTRCRQALVRRELAPRRAEALSRVAATVRTPR